MGFLKRIYKWIEVTRLIDSYSGKNGKIWQNERGNRGQRLGVAAWMEIHQVRKPPLGPNLIRALAFNK